MGQPIDITGAVTRFVLVNYRSDRPTEYARQLDVSNCEVLLSLQDDGKTLKAFLMDPESDTINV